MSKMALHGPFGHLQHKLWQKEGPRVKLAIWLSTTKSRELTRPWCVQVEYDTPLESYRGKLQLCFRPRPNWRSQQRVMIVQSPESPNRELPGQFRDSSLGVPRQKLIRMWVPRRGTKYTIWGKVVASSEFGPWWVMWVQSCPCLVLAPRVLQKMN
jgi:hypothetical protein